MNELVIVLKCLGAVLLAGASYCLGVSMKKGLKERVSLLASLQDALRYFDNKLSVSGLLLEDGLRSCGEMFYQEQQGRDLFSLAAERLSSGEQTVAEAWQDSVDLFAGSEYLKEEDKLAIKEVASALGNADGEHQSANIAVAVGRLQELEKKAEAARAKDGNLVVKLAVAIAAVLIILLW